MSLGVPHAPTGSDVPPQKGPKIRMPEDKRGKIEAKLADYRARLVRHRAEAAIRGDDYQPPESRLVPGLTDREAGTVYKIALAEALLRDGEVDTFELSRRLSKEHGGLAVDRFNNACAVLLSYCEGRR